MNRFRLLAIGTVLLGTAMAPAQQPTPTVPDSAAKDRHGASPAMQGDLPTVEQQLKVLAEKLNLSGSQQARIKPVLQELHDVTLKLMEDKGLSQEDRLARVRPYRYKTDRQLRDMLNDDQKKKLDEYEQGPHPEMHGGLNGGTSSASPPR